MNQSHLVTHPSARPAHSDVVSPVERRCPMPDELAPHIRSSYRRLALIVDESDLKSGDFDGPDTLFVCCDWLAWHRLTGQGKHAVFYELGIMDHGAPANLSTDILNHANDWCLSSDDDPSDFHGVTLSRLFGAEMSMAIMNFYRFDSALRGLIKRFSPAEIIYFNFKYDINHLSAAMRRDLVAGIVGALGLSFVDQSTDHDDDHQEKVGVLRHREHDASSFKKRAVSLYAAGLDYLSRLRRIASGNDNNVMLLINSNLAAPILKHYEGGPLAPVIYARTVPRRIGLLWHALRKGVYLANPPTINLTKNDFEILDGIIARLREKCAGDLTTPLGFAYRYVADNLLNRDNFIAAAKEVLTAEAILEKYRPKRLVVDGVRARRHLSYISLAHTRGIAIDYMWHAPLTPQSFKLSALCGDRQQQAMVTRCLTWGSTNEKWLDRIGAPQATARIGSPLKDKYINSGMDNTYTQKSPEDTNVLILQYGFGIHDLVGLNANMYGAFVHTVRILRSLGYRHLKYKLHPGPGRWAKQYFEKIAALFGLECEVLMAKPFKNCLDWADIVIGPTKTGAMFESLAAGKPYYALLLHPNSVVDKSYFNGYPIIESLHDLAAALKHHDPADGKKVLNDLYSLEEIPNPSQRFWEALSKPDTQALPR